MSLTTSLLGAIGAMFLLHIDLAAALNPLSDWHDGIATYYGGPADNMDPYSPSYGTKDGACGYYQLDKTKWPYWSVGALTPTNTFSKTGPAQACGECFEIWCQPGSPGGDCNPNPNQRRVTIMITDVCAPCNPGGDNQIDIQALTFLKIAPWSGGRIYIKYRRVDCTPPSSIKLQLLNVNGDGAWLRMTVQEVAGTGSVAHVEVKGQSDDTWAGLSNYWGAAWEVAQAPHYPLDIRIVNDAGQEVVAYDAIKADGSTSSQLPPDIQFTTSAPNVTAFSGGPPGAGSDPACNDPDVSAFSLDVNAQTPQASNAGIPKCTAPPPPPPTPQQIPPPASPVPIPQPVLPAPLPQQLIYYPAQPPPTNTPAPAASMPMLTQPLPASLSPSPVQPQPSPQPSPQPQTNPQPSPQPSPQPQLSAQVQPSPQSIPQPQPSPYPGPYPSPYPSPQPSPQLQPSPQPSPQPQLSRQSSPQPSPLPSPAGAVNAGAQTVTSPSPALPAVQPSGPAVNPSPALPAGQPGQPTGAAPTAGNPCACADIPPDATYTCQQQASFGKCTDPFMIAPSPQLPGGFCAATCKRCPGCASNA